MFALAIRVVEGLFIFFLMFAIILLRSTARSIPAPTKNAPEGSAVARLWAAYLVRWRTVLASTWFWGAAGLVTAFLLIVNRP